jgi:hypothetical protein
MTKRERSRLWREARAAAEGRVLLTREEATARMHAAAHAKQRAGMCLCGVCAKCKRRAAMRRARAPRKWYRSAMLSPELTFLFPIFAEELSSTMRYPVRKRKRGAL